MQLGGEKEWTRCACEWRVCECAWGGQGARDGDESGRAGGWGVER